jgi:hypothetical protein
VNHDQKVTVIKLVKQQYPQVDWSRFEDIDRALNFELWYGTANEYWGHAEDLEHYTWEGFEKAVADIEEVLEPLPHELWFDCEGGSIVTDSDPEDYEGYWNYPCEYCGEWLFTEDSGKSWIDDTGGDCCSGNDELENENEPHKPDYNNPVWNGGEWEKFNVRKAMMFDETYKQVF